MGYGDTIMEQQQISAGPVPTYGPFVETCKSFGHSRSSSYQLVKQGWLVPFHIGRKVFIYFDQLHSLPERMAKQGART